MIDISKIVVPSAFKHIDATQGLADGISSGFSSIRYKGKIWSLNHGGKSYPFLRPDDGTPLSYIDVVIVAVGPISRIYFGQEAWSEDSAGAPLCSAIDGIAPDPGVSMPQAKTCAVCPNNVWLTKTDGRRGKYCQDHKRMAVLLRPEMTKKMIGAPIEEPVFLKIPPGSFKPLKILSDSLVHRGIPFMAVVTRIAFNPQQLFEMTFNVVKVLDNQEAKVVLPWEKAAQTLTIVKGSGPRSIAAPRPTDNIDSGLLQTFTESPKQNGGAVAAPKPRGRPSKKNIEQAVVQATVAAQASTPEPSPPGDYVESDPDLDEALVRLVGDKMGVMLK